MGYAIYKQRYTPASQTTAVGQTGGLRLNRTIVQIRRHTKSKRRNRLAKPTTDERSIASLNLAKEQRVGLKLTCHYFWRTTLTYWPKQRGNSRVFYNERAGKKCGRGRNI